MISYLLRYPQFEPVQAQVLPVLPVASDIDSENTVAAMEQVVLVENM